MAIFFVILFKKSFTFNFLALKVGIVSALNIFLYFVSNNPINNPNLKPEKTIDYEIGFQQKLTNTSSLLSLFIASNLLTMELV